MEKCQEVEINRFVKKQTILQNQKYQMKGDHGKHEQNNRMSIQLNNILYITKVL